MFGQTIPREGALEAPEAFARIVGKSATLTPLIAKARMLASVDASVLLYGETGVGKEVFARAIHEHGASGRKPFIALNCGGLPRELLASELFGYVDGAFTGARRAGVTGKVAAADGGTLFLDEIGELPLDLQPYLLRVLEGGEIYPLGSHTSRRVRFRVIAACNRDLRLEVQRQRFRMDLFYRISATSLLLPPLRERAEDLPLLVAHFAEGFSQRNSSEPKTFTPQVLEAFARYDWPGNLRELRNVVEVMMLMSEGDRVDLTALPAELREPYPLSALTSAEQDTWPPPRPRVRLRDAERTAIEAAIQAHGGNVTLIARTLGVSRSTLYIKLRKYELEQLLSEARS
ncbi:MAG: sigma 54-interacting transcriptional regulator [Polyangiales bacterium]